jgi:hypothetical protein
MLCAKREYFLLFHGGNSIIFQTAVVRGIIALYTTSPDILLDLIGCLVENVNSPRNVALLPLYRVEICCGKAMNPAFLHDY